MFALGPGGDDSLQALTTITLKLSDLEMIETKTKAINQEIEDLTQEQQRIKARIQRRKQSNAVNNRDANCHSCLLRCGL